MRLPPGSSIQQLQAALGAFERVVGREMIRIGAVHGWGEYRTATYFQKQVMQTYSFTNHALMRFNERLKDAIDPQGIIAPGRYDIWPQALRTQRS